MIVELAGFLYIIIGFVIYLYETNKPVTKTGDELIVIFLWPLYILWHLVCWRGK